MLFYGFRQLKCSKCLMLDTICFYIIKYRIYYIITVECFDKYVIIDKYRQTVVLLSVSINSNYICPEQIRRQYYVLPCLEDAILTFCA